MRVAKWGQKLGSSTSQEVVETLRLKEGSEITINVAEPREVSLQDRQQAFERLRKITG